MCAGCGEPVDLNEQPWTILGNGKLIHYAGSFELKCWRMVQP